MKLKTLKKLTLLTFILTGLQLSGCSNENAVDKSENEAPEFIDFNNVNVVAGSTNVATLKALDPEGDALEFDIYGGDDASLFSIDSITGELSFIASPNASSPIDADRNNIFNIEVSVSDDTSTVIRDIEITLADSSSNQAPNFISSSSIIATLGTTSITTLIANDPNNDVLRYSISAGADATFFTLDPLSGELSFKSLPNPNVPEDANQDSIYSIEISVSDGTLITKQIFEISYSVNTPSNLSPVFNSESDIKVSGSSQNVTTIIAEDSDSSVLNFSITGGADAAYFFLEPQTGVLNFISLPNAEIPSDTNQDNIFEIKISVSDGNTSTTKTFTITLLTPDVDTPIIGNSNFDPNIYANTNRAAVVQGGKLYDKWWQIAANSTEPTTTHSRWPASNTTVSGSSTWRCKECHGWDYRGADGAYASGKHATGFGGIVSTNNFTMQYPDAASVYAFLREDTNHGFNNGLFTDPEYYALTRFIMSMRQEATAGVASFNFIDDNTKLATNGANANNGKILFETSNSISCSNSSCHGANGKLIDFNDRNRATLPNTFIHNIAQENPWELIHKARFGDPKAFMPTLYDANDASITTINAAADILAYAQSDLVPDIQRAGRLYDKWWNVDGIIDPNVPTTRNQTWINSVGTTDSTIVSDSSTWRCKECHGWDYQGVNGAYGYNGDATGKHYSGILGFFPTLNTTVKDKAYIFEAIKNGVTGSQLVDHNFGRFLSDKDINLLAEFITDENLGVPKLVTTYNTYLTGGSSDQGKTIYDSISPGNCANCHGTNGTLIPTVDVNAVANDNPQEFIHKVRFGHPGSSMLPTSNGFTGLDLTSASNVLAYAKTLNSGTNPNPIYTYAIADVVRGGRLYDKWWKEMQAADSSVLSPADYNPYWAGRSANLPDFPASYSETKKIETSWRCKSCHGWDYKGTGYETGVPSTNGADNLIYKIELRRNSTFQKDETALQQYIYDWIKSGLGTNHQFGTATTQIPSAMGERELWDLTKFLLEGGIINNDSNIQSSGIAIGTNNINGEGLYSGSINTNVNCIVCHGINGDTPPPTSQGGSGEALDIFQISSAGENPWEFVHKTRFGQPGTSMPGIFGVNNLTNKDAFDILGYSQQQFNSRP